MNRYISMFEQSDLANICSSGGLFLLLCEDRQKAQSKHGDCCSCRVCHWFLIISNCRPMRFYIVSASGCRKQQKLWSLLNVWWVFCLLWSVCFCPGRLIWPMIRFLLGLFYSIITFYLSLFTYSYYSSSDIFNWISASSIITKLLQNMEEIVVCI